MLLDRLLANELGASWMLGQALGWRASCPRTATHRQQCALGHMNSMDQFLNSVGWPNVAETHTYAALPRVAEMWVYYNIH